MVRALLVENDLGTVARVEELMRRHHRLQLLDSVGTGKEALIAVDGVQPDLLLLSVDLPGMDGFRVLEGIPRPDRPEVVVLASRDSDAAHAYDVGAVDCVLKPVEDERLHLAFLRALRAVDVRRGRTAAAAPAASRLFIQDQGRSGRFVSVSEITHIEALNNYVRIHHGGRSHLMRSALVELEARLDSRVFQRVHRSFVVNMARVKAISPRGSTDYEITMDDGTVIPVGRVYRDQVLADV